MDLDTREWSDGIITYASRQAVKEGNDVKTWIICDGDVDPEWVESLNSDLDDNRLLTMPNGERIQFGPNVNFIFETHNLKFASPATVSRMGMIFLSDETIDVKSVVDAWLLKLAERNNISQWIESYFYKCVDWVSTNAEAAVEVSKIGLVLNGLSCLSNSKSKTEFACNLIKGFGSNLLVDDRVVFANLVFEWIGIKIDSKKPLNYFIDLKGNLQEYQLKSVFSQEDSSIFNYDRLPIIETIDVQRNFDIINNWIKNGESFVLVGPPGAGKQMILRHCFAQSRNITVATINCSSQTRSLHILQRINQICVGVNTNNGRVMRPRDSEKLIILLKDINLPAPDKYESVEMIQFLQMLLIYHGFYDSNLEWVGIENIQIICTMNPSSTIGRHKLSTRFSSVIRQLYISYTDQEQLNVIYRILLQPILQFCLPSHQIWSVPKNFQRLSITLVNVFIQVRQNFIVDAAQHYIFTPRDISRLVTSLNRFQYSDLESPNELLEIVAYEFNRIFCDKLVDDESQKKFSELLSSIFQNDWNISIKTNSYFTTLNSTKSKDVGGSRILTYISNEKYTDIIAKEIAAYERDIKDLNLFLFDDVLSRISRMERVLGTSGGSLLLAGRPGIGRKSAVEIACHMLKLRTVYLNIGRTYTQKTFKIDLKSFIQASGIQGEEIAVIIEDYQLIEPAMLESINSLLSGGEVPGLFANDELDGILSSLKSLHSEEGVKCSVFEFFCSRVLRNLHFVLLFDSSDPKFIVRCESNPSLYSRCYMEWSASWRFDVMNTIVNAMLSKDEYLKAVPGKNELISKLISIHQYMAKSHGSSPRHLLEYVATYQTIFKKQKSILLDKFKYLSGGLSKLSEATSFVDNLSINAQKQSLELVEKQKLADLSLKHITESMMNASDQKKEMEILTVQLAEEEEKMTARKEVIEKALEDVEPIVRSAKAAVGEIRNESLSEIRSLRAPPAAVRDVLEGVLRLMGNLDMSWNSMKGFLGKRTVKEEIMNFDARNITKTIRESVQDLIRQKQDSFEEATIKRSSVAAAPLALWVKANLQYSTVLEKIGPLEADLLKLTRSLTASKSRVQKLKEDLSIVDQTVSTLRNDFASKTRDAEMLKSSVEKALATIKSAHALLEKLSGEGNRWSIQSKLITESLESLPTKLLLSAAFVTYLGEASEIFRENVCNDWKRLIGLSSFSFLSTLCTENDQLNWKQEGLSPDTLSLENALVILNSKSTPLLVDPSGRAVLWLKQHFYEQKFEIVKQHDPNFIRTVELSLRFGKNLIITEVADIEPSLYPVLRRDLLKQGPRFFVQLGDKQVDYNEGFKIFLISKQSSFAIPSNAAGLVNEVNFTITRDGLAAQLLGLTIKHEKPELEVEKIKMLKNEDLLKIQLSQLEESLLNSLASSEGNILENTSLINSLNETKVKSISINETLMESRNLQSGLDEERDKFMPFSKFGSSLYFVIDSLKKLNNMYEISLKSFLGLFEVSLKKEEQILNVEPEQRNKVLMCNLEKLIFGFISRLLFKNDRPMFALYMIHSTKPELFGANEWELFTGIFISGESISGDSISWIPSDKHTKINTFVVYVFNSRMPFMIYILSSISATQ